MKKEINLIIQNFKEFLEQSSSSFLFSINHFENSESVEELRNDWLQANWEILVEAVLCKLGEEFLEVYGEGADCNGASSRVCYPQALPTHKVTCKQKNEELFVAFDQFTKKAVQTEAAIFHSFVFFDGMHYHQNGLLNAVLLEKKDEIFLFYLDEIDFILNKARAGVSFTLRTV